MGSPCFCCGSGECRQGVLVASADGDEVVDAASHAGRKIKATWQVGRERKVSTGPERQQESRESQQQC